MLIAILAQSATLDADTARAATACADAWLVAAPAEGVSRFLTSSGVGYYLLQLAAADPQGEPLLTRMSELAHSYKPNPVSLAEAKALMPQCDLRFPMARTTELAILPADPFDRDRLCFAVTSIQVGAAQGQLRAEHDGSALERWQPVQRRYAMRLSGKIPASQLSGEAVTDSLFGPVMRASLRIGNFDSISLSCEAEMKRDDR
ncbi:hypothetical protein OF829_18370 [Sphingomonas sp. LB-2]|uniref:hypothetical protein n=1 Tax=Sphingomonas caeni TaxID=2984949 RepID=UPI00222FB3F0|nr:hypothetical protein [Sphingomonas caeni]MCW3849207.1 hypothetical protein [Sphingomonas caeni]